ncbi:MULTISPECIES: AraC family transcriptional regulator [Pseudomonas]|uniref:AraC family transcriptional regulator n=1 Tax=Pseudomonas syringae Cit 7 TaxID=629264 RepID=A0A8T8M2A0_PSESX|nr:MULTISPECIES: AraC family transcriptional regulator [Pseudomonas]KTC16227.1 AraC family transcriptional regulator [Pseudomonas sp. ICMP 10191]MCK9696097.1 AraC family transcriptional regulator [Pseudomonas syringae pv. syringae]MCK9713048.1 AraC family transcriptional regulator [Pseudomonas syringae pv. syringae]MCK9716543.1 AraC family transcriptional regulator [Pseudomonas syringae pv. syringae]MCK9728772.1 AraC family transcriptional regulator [Pseudomonas syringae pv. syringae]
MNLPVVLDGNATLVSLIQPLAVRPGFVATPLPEVRVLSAFGYVASSPQIYEPSLMIVVQGSKVACLGPRTFEYGTGHYLIQALSVPFKCETFATLEKPLYGVSVAIDRVLLGELVQAMGPVTGQESQVQTPESMTSVRIDNSMRDSVERLLRCLHDPLECQAMGQARIREVLYSALRGPQSGVLRALVEQQGQFARIASAVTYLHEHYDHALNVDTLASCANMSTSTFHEHFKRSTLLSPVQYLKRLRLLKAQQLLVAEGLGVAQVALKVGYQSASQFSREYKRYFERSPGEESSNLRVPA